VAGPSLHERNPSHGQVAVRVVELVVRGTPCCRRGPVHRSGRCRSPRARGCRLGPRKPAPTADRRSSSPHREQLAPRRRVLQARERARRRATRARPTAVNASADRRIVAHRAPRRLDTRARSQEHPLESAPAKECTTRSESERRRRIRREAVESQPRSAARSSTAPASASHAVRVERGHHRRENPSSNKTDCRVRVGHRVRPRLRGLLPKQPAFSRVEAHPPHDPR